MSIKFNAAIIALGLAATFACSAQGVNGTPASRNPAPGIDRVQLQPSTPAELERALKARQLPKNLNAGFTVSSAGAARAASPVAVTSSIPELARALKNDPDLIYEYVRNTIEYYPVWGVHKGAMGALLDSQGTSFDQAALMVALLRQAGYTASFVRGGITLNATQIRDWLGVDTALGCSVALLFANGGVPIASRTPAGSCPGTPGALSSITIGHVWVKAVINGTAYHFDPSYKPHTLKAGINLATTTGYNAATFLANSKVGTTATTDYVQNVNRANVRSQLTAYSNTLASWLRANSPSAMLEDAVGGKAIVPLNGSGLRQLQLPYVSTSVAQEEWTTDIPANYKPVLSFSFNGISGSATSDAVYGHRLTITFNASNQPELRFDGAVASTGAAMTPGSTAVATISVTHPYSGADQSFPQSIKYVAGSTYFLNNGWGPVGRGLVEYMRAGLDSARDAGNADTSEPVLGSALGVLGASWMAQTNFVGYVTGRIAKTSIVYHHQVGLAGHSGSPYVDLPGNRVSVISEVGDSTKEAATFYAIVGHSSIFESTAVQQTTGVAAVSTVRLIDIAASGTDKIFDARSTNYTTVVQPGLVSCASYLAAFQARINDGARLILPQRCNITQGSWSGVGYYDIKAPSIGAIISGNLAGGFASTPQTPVVTVANTSALTISDDFLKQFTGLSFGDPIDMVKGHYLYSRNDITTGVGEFPSSLSVQRLYSSGARTVAGPMGLGWTHNLAASVSVGTDGFQGLGEDSALDAVPSLVEQMVALDLMTDAATPIDKIVIATLGQAWLGEQLTNNTVIVRQGLNGEVFVKLPDGSYNPPRGNSAKLSLSGGLYTYETVNKARMNFNAANKISSYVHPSGVEARFTYNGNDLAQVQNSFGRTLTFTNVGGRVTNIGDGTRSVGYGYTGGNLTSFSDATSQATTFQYDIPGRLWKMFYPSNPAIAFVTNTYDALGRVQTQTNANGKVYTYFFAGNRSEELGPPPLGAGGPVGARRISYIDDQGKVIKAIDPVGRVTLNTYDGQSRLVRSDLPEGNRVEYVYDDAPCAAQLRCTHNVKTIRRVAKTGSGLPDLTSSFTYESAFNQLWTATDPRGQVTTTTYTAQGLPNTVTSPVDNAGVQPVTTFGYTAYSAPQAGFPIVYLQTSTTSKTTATNSVVNTTSFNPSNKLVPQSATADSGSGKLNLTSTFVYDAVGNLKQVDGPRSDVIDITTFDYDNERRRIKITNAIGEQTIVGYDPDGRPNRTARSLDPDFPGYWMVSCSTYTPSGKQLKTWGPGLTSASTSCPTAAPPVAVVDFGYDDVDRVRSVTQNLTPAEGGNRVSVTDYFADDSVQAVRRAVGTAVAQTYAQYTYSPNGLLATQTDARSYRTTYEYDGHDRRNKVRFPDKSSINASSTTDYEQYGFDNNGNVTSIRRRNGQNINLGYDNLNRLLTRTYPLAADNAGFGYDLLGRRTSANKGDGYNVSYEWDNAGRLKKTSAGGRDLNYEYDLAGNRTKIIWPDTAFATTTFDALNRPSQIKELGTTVLATYAYYPMSLRKTVTLGNGTVTSYAYNGQSDLSSLAHDLGGTAADVSFVYTRNQAGEITNNAWNNENYAWRPTPAANGTKTFVPNGQNQYTSITGASPSHDGNGNLAGDGTWTYGYDPDNRLKSATKTGYSGAIVYDAEGRMRQTTLGGTVKNLLYDGDDLVAEYDAAGTMLKRYVHGPGIDEPLVAYDGAGLTKSWVYADHLGSVIAQADGTGTSSATYKYGPFGEPDTTSGLRFRYTGQQYIGALDLYHYKARFYSHTMGRFLQTDPIGYADDSNLYAYVGNDPVNAKDPEGTLAIQAGAFAIGFAIDVAAQYFIEGKSFSGGIDLRKGTWGTISLRDAALSGAGAALTGGVGAWGAAAATRGTISVGQAVAATTATGFAAGAGVSATSDLLNGNTPSLAKMAISGAGGAVGSAVAAKLSTSAATMVNRMASAGGVMDHMAGATYSATNFGARVRLGTSIGQELGKVGTDTASAFGGKYFEQMLPQGGSGPGK